MLQAFLQGAQEAGAMTEMVFLQQKKIHHCLGCFSCWFKTPGDCIQNDDMPGLIEKFTTADVVVFAGPLHNDNISGLLKDFIDRLLPLGDPHFEKDENGECCHVNDKGHTPQFVMMANCGFPEQSHFAVLRLLTERMARNYLSEFIAQIYRGGAMLLQEPSFAPFARQYSDLLKTAGKEIVVSKRLSEVTRARLEEPLVPAPDFVDRFVTNANAYVDAVLSGKPPG